jgi:FkbM family methyltransferase
MACRPVQAQRNIYEGNTVRNLVDKVNRRLRALIKGALYTPRFRVSAHGHSLVRLGSSYGGWTLIDTPTLRGAKVISCGLGEDASLDVELVARYGAEVLIIDPTPKSIDHFDSMTRCFGQPRAQDYAPGGKQPVGSYDLSQISARNFQLVPKALWNEETRLKFFLPVKASHVSHSIVNIQNNYRTDTPYIEVDATTLDRILAQHGIGEIALLKLDIEGAEIEVIADMVAKGIRPTQLAVEFDELNFPSRRSAQRVRTCHELLLAHGYQLIKIDKPSNFLYSTLTDHA